ncbi:MAG: ELWxxDGT repeat protein, partial [Chloroflexota bacterium]
CGRGISGLAQTTDATPSAAPVGEQGGTRPVSAVAGITLIPPTAAAAGIASGARSYRDTVGAKPAYLTPYLGSLVFSAREDGRGRELWIATPTTARRLKDIAPGATSSSPRDFVVLDGIVYFSAGDGTHGRELWRTDGTGAGTRMVKDIRPGTRGSNPGSFIVFRDRVFFAASDGTHGGELWRTDGTSAGTRMVKDISVGRATGVSEYDYVQPTRWVVMGDILYFDARRSYNELWRTDGTSGGTQRIASQLILFSRIVSTGSRLFLLGSHDDGGCALDGPFLFTSDGTTAGTRELTAAKYPWAELVAFRRLAMFGNMVERANGDITERPRLWRSEGTNATTVQTRPTVTMDELSPMQVEGGRLFVRVGGGLAASNATGGQVTVLGDTADGWRATVDVAAAGGRWFFPAGQRSTRELWQTDGTPAGTRQALDINSRGNGAVNSLVSQDGVVWFVGDDGIRGQQLWRYVPPAR